MFLGQEGELIAASVDGGFQSRDDYGGEGCDLRIRVLWCLDRLVVAAGGGVAEFGSCVLLTCKVR